MLASRIQAYCQNHIHLVSGSIIVPDGATGPQLPKKRKYPLQVDYQLGSYLKPSHLSSKKFRTKLSYKLKTSVVYSIINFEALFINHGWFFFFFQKLDLELTLASGIFAISESIKEKSISATSIICINGSISSTICNIQLAYSHLAVGKLGFEPKKKKKV